jgi:DNA-binding transcriptional regulator YbjK
VARVPSLERRRLLVEAALRVIARDGMNAATTRAVVGEASMSLASFHYAFTSRDEMMRELVAHVVENETVAAFSGLRLGADIRTSIRDALNAFFEGAVIADPEHEQVMFEIMQYALRTPSLRHLAAEQYSRYRAAVTELLIAGATSAGVTWSRPVDDVARIVLTLTDGLTFGWLADRDTDAARRVIEFAADSLSTLAVPAPATIPPTAHEERSL